MKDGIIAIAIVVVLIVGFWWTRGAGGIPGGSDDPAREEVRRRFGPMGSPAPRVGEDGEDREHEVE
jgi:hypothetical protein